MLNDAIQTIEEANAAGRMGGAATGDGPAMRPPGANECLICGSHPARPVALRKINAFVLWHKTLKFTAPLCRICGTAIFRDLQSGTMASGWWGPLAFFANCLAVLSNLSARSTVVRVPPPAGRDPAVVSILPAPLPAGPPVVSRPRTYLAVLAFLLAFSIIGGAVDSAQREPTTPVGDDDASFIGSCWDLQGTSDLVQIACDHRDANYRVARVVGNPMQCPGDGFIRTPSGRAGCLVSN